MSRRTRHSIVVPLLIASLLLSALPVGAQPAEVYLQPGTPLRIHATEDISSGRVKTGDTVYFTVAAPLMVGGLVVVAPGAEARGRVVESKHASGLGRNGKLVLAIDSVTAVDGTQIPLRAHEVQRGANNAVLSVGLAVFVSVFAIFIQGREAVVKSTRDFDVYVDQGMAFRQEGDRVVAISPAPRPPLAPPPAPAHPSTIVLKTQVGTGIDGNRQPQAVNTAFVPNTQQLVVWWVVEPVGFDRRYEVRFYRGTQLMTSTEAEIRGGTDRAWAGIAPSRQGFELGEWHADILEHGQLLATQYFQITNHPPPPQ